MNDEKVIQAKIESWVLAGIFTFFLYITFLFFRKKWNELPKEEREKFKKGCKKDLKRACILTIIVVVVMIATDSFE